MVQSKLHVAVVGGAETVERKLVEFLRNTQADELIFTSDVYDHAARLRSFEIAATVMKDVSRDMELLSHR